jgi:hypothetical protein
MPVTVLQLINYTCRCSKFVSELFIKPNYSIILALIYTYKGMLTTLKSNLQSHSCNLLPSQREGEPQGSHSDSDREAVLGDPAAD